MLKIKFIDEDENMIKEVLTLDYKVIYDQYGTCIEFVDLKNNGVWVILKSDVIKISKVSRGTK